MLGCSIKIFDVEEVYEENGVETTAHQDKYCGGSFHGNSESQEKWAEEEQIRDRNPGRKESMRLRC